MAKSSANGSSNGNGHSSPASPAIRPKAPPGGFRHGGKTYRAGKPLPKRYAAVVAGEPITRDADGLPNVPPRFGRWPVQQVTTHQGQFGVLAHVYRSPDEALRHSVENARFMRNDCSVMECLEARQRGTALLPWHVEVEDKKDPRQKHLSEALTRILKNIPFFTEYRRNLLEALWYGRYACQHTHGFLRSSDGKRYAIVNRWLPINGDKLVFRYDDGSGKFTGDEIGVRTGMSWPTKDAVNGDKHLEPADGNGMVYFLKPQERSRLVVHKHIIEDGSFETPISAGRIHGVGIRDRIYWTWYQKQETMAALMEIIQRTGAGFTIYYFPHGNQAAENKVRELAIENQQANTLFVPRMAGDPSMDAYGIERIEPSSVGIEAMRTIIHEFFGWQIKRYILGQILSSESAATGLGSGVADLHMASFTSIISYDASKLEETITAELLRPLQHINFRWADNIQAWFRISVGNDESEKLLAAYRTAWEMGAKIKTVDVMDAIGASMPEPTDEVLVNPQIAGAMGQGQPGVDGGPSGDDGQPNPLENMVHHSLADGATDALGGQGDENEPPEPWQYAKERDPDLGDSTERAHIIAAILHHIYGDKADGIANELFGSDSDAEQYAKWKPATDIPKRRSQVVWNASDHPRGPGGRFIKKGSPEAHAATKSKIADALKAPKTADSAKELMSHLNLLTTDQLQDLQKEHGIQARGKDDLKADWVGKLAVALDKGRRGDASEREEAPEKESSAKQNVASEPEPDDNETKDPTNGEAAADDGTSGRQPDDGRPDSGGADRGGGEGKPRSSRILTDREHLTKPADVSRVPENLRPHLNESQQQGTAKAIAAMDEHGGFLLADGTGVGKTRQLLAVAHNYAGQGKKVVIVAPSEVIKPDWKKGTAAGSYAKDSEAMGVGTTLGKGDQPLEPGKVRLTTYNELGKLKDQIDGDTVVLFDESHAMKNSNSQRGKDGRDISFKAGKVLYATATPADKPLHIAHLIRAGVFGGGSPSAKKFFGKSEDTYRKLGLTTQEIRNPYTGQTIKKWVVDKKVGAAEVARRMQGLFDQMTKDGLMVQRSLSMDNVDADAEHVRLSPEAHAETQAAYDRALAEHPGNKALAVMAMRRAQEPHKIPHAVDAVKKELAEGRAPIIFLGRVNDPTQDDEGDDDDALPDENTAKLLKAALIEAGVSESDIGELHGGAAKTADAKKRAMNHFNAGKTKVLISTLQSGGTGVNLDDTEGNRPRTVVMMTPPLSANDMIQAAGRVNRLSTKSKARVVSLVSDHPIDQWNMGLLGKKMKTLGAVSGKNLGHLMGEAATDEVMSQDYDWGHSLVGTPKPAAPAGEKKPETAPDRPAAKSESRPSFTRKVNTKNGPRHVTSFSPSSKFWDLRKAGKLPSAVSVSKNPRTGQWEASVWGKDEDEVRGALDQLSRLGIGHGIQYAKGDEPERYTKDAHGHEHAPAGTSEGGQFVSKGSPNRERFTQGITITTGDKARDAELAKQSSGLTEKAYEAVKHKLPEPVINWKKVARAEKEYGEPITAERFTEGGDSVEEYISNYGRAARIIGRESDRMHDQHNDEDLRDWGNVQDDIDEMAERWAREHFLKALSQRQKPEPPQPTRLSAEQPQPKRFAKRQTVKRDERGLIIETVTTEEEIS